MDHSGFPVFEWKTVEVMKGVFVIRLCEIPEKHRYGISVLVFGMVLGLATQQIIYVK
jgi:hypothetical protein